MKSILFLSICTFVFVFFSNVSFANVCGSGNQFQTVSCIRSDGTAVPESYCDPGTKPSTSASCSIECVCSPSCQTGNYCSGNTQYFGNGCVGGTCDNQFVANCPTNNYCGGNTRYFSGGCNVGSGTCGYQTEDCNANGNICWEGNIYLAPWTCSPNECQYSGVTTCNARYCDGNGNVFQESGCSGSSCTGSVVEACTNGCSAGQCIVPVQTCTYNTVVGVQSSSGNYCYFGDGSVVEFTGYRYIPLTGCTAPNCNGEFLLYCNQGISETAYEECNDGYGI